jgi:L-fuconolactonase
MRVDAHHHVWSLARGDYGWLTPALAPIYRDFDLDDYARIAPPGVVSVLVQAAPTVAETRFLLDVARRSDGRARAVVGWVDLDADDACDTLAELAADPLLKSIRPMLQDIADPDWVLRPRVQRALAALPQLRMRFDALVKPVQLPALVKALERNPDLRAVIDHGAKPRIAERQWAPWADLVRAAAAHPNVFCKLSGLVTEAAPGWTLDTLRPYVDHLLDCFGAGRVMWGSDWPVVELNGGFARWSDATDALLGTRDAKARSAILGDNARRFYGLGAA